MANVRYGLSINNLKVITQDELVRLQDAVVVAVADIFKDQFKEHDKISPPTTVDGQSFVVVLKPNVALVVEEGAGLVSP